MEREAKAARPTSEQAESTFVETSLPTAHDAQGAGVSFPVIGIGASAGGLEAVGQPQQSVESKAQSALDKVVILLREQTGNDFSEYKKSTLYRRIERRMSLRQVDKIASYVRFLHENPQEVEQLFKELLVGVTSFFREPDIWEQLKSEAMPRLLVGRPPGQPLRAWVPACSTGEEAYSLAIAFREAVEQTKSGGRFTLQVFGTDLDSTATEKARQGVYPANIAADVSEERLRRFFVQEDQQYRVSKEIREMVIFAPQNVAMDPPFTKLDLLTCRNLLIYLAPELQKKLLRLFHYSLNPGGILMLGSAETIGSATDLFAVVDSKARIYRRLEAPRVEPMEFPSRFTAMVPEPFARPAAPSLVPSLQMLADRVILDQKALPQKGEVIVKGLKVGTNGGEQTVDLTVQLLQEPEALRGMVMVVINDVTVPPETSKPTPTGGWAVGSRGHAALAEQELQRARQEALLAVEELQTVNAELQAKLDELSHASNDMKNVLDSTDIAILFLDNALNVRRFTARASRLIGLIPSDSGRPISDIASDLIYPGLIEDANEVIRSLMFSEKQITTRDGRWFAVRIMPYRTLENVIDGVVITLMDITASKVLEADLREKERKVRALLASKAKTPETVQ